MRDDENPPDTVAIPRPGTLPPSAKTVAVVFAGIERISKEVGLPVLALLAGRWGLLEPKAAGDAFLAALSFVLGGHFGLRRGETQER